MEEANSVSVDDWSDMPAFNPNAGMKSELILSAVSIVIVVAIVLILKKMIKKRAEKQGKEEKHPFRVILKWYYILVAIAFPFYLWLGNEKYNGVWEGAFLIGVPIGMSLAVIGDGWIDTLKSVFGSSLVVALVLHLANVIGPFRNNFETIVKIISSIAFVISAFSMFKSKGDFLRKPTLPKYRGYAGGYTNSYSGNSSNPFEGGDFKKKKNWSGGYDYIDAKTGKVIAQGKIGLFGEETIVDEHGNTILQERDNGIFGSSYKDANGNTVYKKDTNIFGDNQIKDANGNTIFEDDSFERWLWGDSNYKKK